MRRMTTLVSGVAAALLVAAAPARAAETVGSDLSGTPNFGAVGLFTYTQLVQPPGVLLPLTASVPGVLVEIRIKHLPVTSDATGGFSILSGAASPFAARTSALLPNFAWANGDTGEIRSITPVPDASGHPRGVPIAAGERLAYRLVSAPAPPMFQTGSGTMGYHNSDHVSGSQPYLPAIDTILMQMRVEPDADRDGYGDETQDPCPFVAGLKCAPPCENATMVGTSGNDVIVGTPGNDVIATHGGDDVVRGLGGNDIICGGDGNDTLKGGAGADWLYGEAGRDKLKGARSADYCNGGLDKDKASRCEKATQI